MPQDMYREPGRQVSQDEDAFGDLQADVAAATRKASSAGAAALSGMKDRAGSLGDALGNKARERAEDYVEDGKQAVTQNLDAFAQAIRRAGDELGRGEQTMASQLVGQAARGLERLSRAVDGASLDDMIGSVRRFGRRNPVALIGGAVLVGVALGRFARASSPQTAGRWDEDEWNDAAYRRQDGRSGQAARRSDEDWRGDMSEGFVPQPYSGPSYPAGDRTAFSAANQGFGDMPAPSQGYAGGGMRGDQADVASPSSGAEESLSSSSHATTGQPGAMSTGER